MLQVTSLCTNVQILVYVEWAQKWSRVIFVTIFADLYNFKLRGMCNKFNQLIYGLE